MKKSVVFVIIVYVIFVLILMVSACTATRTEEGFTAKRSAVFDDLLIKEGVRLSSYSSVEIASLTDAVRQDIEQELTEEEIAGQIAELEAVLSEELHKRYNKDLPSQLEIHITLIRLKQSRPTQSDYQEHPALSFETRYLGGAAADFVIKDGRTGETLATFTGWYFGESLRDGNPRYHVWTDAKNAYQRWAKELPNLLNEN